MLDLYSSAVGEMFSFIFLLLDAYEMFTDRLEELLDALGGVIQWVTRCPMHQRVANSIPCLGACLSFRLHLR